MMRKELFELGVNLEDEQRFNLDAAPIVLIRHGFSNYNYCMKKV